MTLSEQYLPWQEGRPLHIEWQGPWVGEVLGMEDLAIFESLLKRIAVRQCPGHFVEKEKKLLLHGKTLSEATVIRAVWLVPDEPRR